MIDKRLFLAFGPLALLTACNDAPEDNGRAASGDVPEGTISDDMLPIDRVRSEAPLEDPEALADVRERATERTGVETPGRAEPAETGSADEADEAQADEVAPDADD